MDLLWVHIISPLTLKALCARLLNIVLSIAPTLRSIGTPSLVLLSILSIQTFLLSCKKSMPTTSQVDYCMQSTWNALLSSARMLKSTSRHASWISGLMQFNLNWLFLLMQPMWMIIYSSHFSSWLQKYWYSIFIVWVFVTCSCPDQFYFGFSSCDTHLVIKLSWLLKTISVPTVQKLLSCVVLFTTHLSATYQNYDSVLATYSKTVGILKSDVPLVLLIISSPSLRVWPKFGDSFYVDIQCYRELQIQLHSLVNLLIPSITLVALCTIPCYQCYIISGNNLWAIKHCWFSSHPLYWHSNDKVHPSFHSK